MPQHRETIRKRTVSKGGQTTTLLTARFYDLAEPGKRPPQADLCTLEEADAVPSGVKRKAFLRRLYEAKREEVRERLERKRQLEEEEAKEQEQPELTEADKHTLGEAIRKYKSSVLAKRVPSFQRSVIQQLEWWQSHLGAKTPLSQITPPRLQRARDTLSQKPRHPNRPHERVSGSTINRYLAALSGLFNACLKEWFWVEYNPVNRLRYSQESPPKDRYLDDDERERLLEVTRRHPNLHLAVMLALSTGARQGEIWNLRWEQVDFERKMVTFAKTTLTKNTKPRSVPLIEETLQLLEAHHKNSDPKVALVFPSKTNKSSGLDFRKPFAQALQAAKIQNFRWHDLRHTAASYLAMSGVPMRTIGEILGQTTARVTERYAHLSPDHLRSSMEQIGARLSSASRI
jgi:integrase